MAQVERPLKTAGNRTYVLEVEDNATTILASEVDDDFAALIEGINTVDTEQLAPLSVTTAKIANDAVTTVKIADSNVTTEKIEDGGTFLQYGRTINGATQTITGSDASYVSQSITLTRTRCRIFGTVNMTASASVTVVVRLKRDTSTTLAAHPALTFTSDTCVFIEILDPTAGAGAHTYDLFVQQTAGGGTPSAVAGAISVYEVV